MKFDEHVVVTDVLVVGGGMAGCFAAIKAREKAKKEGKELQVTLVDKGYVGKSGQTPFAGAFAVFNPEWGHKLEDWIKHVSVTCEYVNNRAWTETVFRDSYARYKDLVSWGVECTRGATLPGPRMRVTEAVHLSPNFPMVLRKQVLASGAKIMDRTMIVELLKENERVVGAVGFALDGPDIYIFKAKATVLCTGAGGFKPAGWPISELTADGHIMAYKVGAEITGKEFADTHSTRADYPALAAGAHPLIFRSPSEVPRRPPRGRLINAEGQEVKGIGTLFLELEFEAHAGRAPVFRVGPDGRKVQVVGGSASGMSVHTAEGVWPADMKCAAADVQGLYAAGDSLGTMMTGAVYSAPGCALCTAAVTGARAGEGAAEYALQAEPPAVGDDEISRAKDAVLAPLERKGGFSPRWVTQVLQGIVIPYYVLYIKHEKRLNAALTLVEFIRDHLVPKLKANDIHELRLCHETKNMVLNAEMRLRASLFRTESRGCHYREDYPRRRDPEWLAWVKLKQENGKMKVWKEPIPKEWWPDLTKPYEERYPVRLPGE